MILLTTLRIWICKYILKSDKMYFVGKVGIPNAPLGSLHMLSDVDVGSTLPFILVKMESGWRVLTEVEQKTEVVKIIQENQRWAGRSEEEIEGFWDKVRAEGKARGMVPIPHLRPSETETQ